MRYIPFFLWIGGTVTLLLLILSDFVFGRGQPATLLKRAALALVWPLAALSRPGRELLFRENRTKDGKRTGMAMGWFTGTLHGERYVAHAGGGGGYYAEIRLYPDLGRGSALLFNRTGVADERALDRFDAHMLAPLDQNQ